MPLFLHLRYVALYVLEGSDRLHEFLHVWSLEQCLPHSKWSVNLSSPYFQGSLWHGHKPCSSVLVTPHELWSGQATRPPGNWGEPRTQWSKGLRVGGLLTFVLTSFKGSRICIIILVQVNTAEHHLFHTWRLFSKHSLCLLINILVYISIMAFDGLNRHLCHIDFWLGSSSH